MNEFEKYLRIARLVRKGEAHKLSKSDYQFFRSFTLDPEALNSLRASDEYNALPEKERQMFDANLAAFQSPQFRESILTLGENIEGKELQDKLSGAMNLALAGADVATSVAQIQASKQAQEQLRRPERPAPLTADPRLEAALQNASRGNMDAVRALSPAQLQILDQYLSDLNTAQTVSGGQAGVYGSLAQVASTRRGRQAAGLAPMYDQIVRQGEQRYDQLLAQKLQENQAINQSQSQFYTPDLYQYGQDARAAAELGAIGRSNLRSSVGAAGNFLAPVISELQTRKRFRDLYNQGLPFGEDNARIIAEADYKIRNPRPQRFSHNQQELEQAYGLPA